MAKKRRVYVKILALILTAVMVFTNVIGNGAVTAADEDGSAASGGTEPARYSVAVSEDVGGYLEYRTAASEDSYALIPEEGLTEGSYDFRYTGEEGYLTEISIGGITEGSCQDYCEGTVHWYQIWTFCNVEVAEDITVDVVETALSVVTVNDGDGAFYYKAEGEDAYQQLTDSTLVLRPGRYALKYLAAEQRAVHIAGLEGSISYAATGEAWQQQWEADVTLAAGGSCTLAVSEAELSIQAADDIVPEFSYSLSVAADTKEAWAADMAGEFTFSTDAEAVSCTASEEGWLLKYDKDSETALETVTVTAANGSIILKKEISVAADMGVIYGTDFTVSDTGSMYAETEDQTLTIYHNGLVKSVDVFNDRYTDYRYRFDEEAYPEDFTAFEEGETSRRIALTGDIMYLQMKNTDSESPMFGSSGAVRIVEDTQAPIIDEDFVQVKGGFFVDSPFGTAYGPEAFYELTLDLKVTEAHLLKVEIEPGGSDNIITLEPNTPEGDVYIFENISLGDAAAFSGGTVKITVYDKAMNTAVYEYSGDSGQGVTYVKNPTVLGAPTVANEQVIKSGRTFVTTDRGTVNISVHISSELLIPELLELKLMKVNEDGSRTETASFRAEGQYVFDVSGSNGEWDVGCNYTFGSADDGGYEIEVLYTDIAENEIISAKSAVIYYIDLTPVTLTVASEQVQNGGITNQAVKLVYTMTEDNPDFGQFGYTYTSTVNSGGSNITDVTLIKPDGTKERIAISELATRINDGAVWAQNGNVYTLTLLYDQESIYNTKLTVADAMGSQAFASYDFRVDLTAPEIISVNVNTEYANQKHTDYNYFDAASAVVTVEVSEEIAKASEIELVCTVENEEEGGETDIMLSSPQQEGNIFTYSFTIKKNFKGVISFKVKDAVNSSAGNAAELVNGIIVEGAGRHKETSACAITENGAANANGFYRRDVSLKLSAQDTYSGIKSVEYSINGLDTAEDFGGEKSIRTIWEKTPVYISASAQNEGNDIEVALTVTDNAGHRDTVRKTFKIDITKPAISVSYDNNSAENKSYYRGTRTAVITIQELNYDSENTKVIVYKNGVPVVVKAAFHSDGKLITGEDGAQYKEYVMQLPFDEDGDYTLKVETTDLAGNKSVYEEKTEFTIDNTLPVLEISYDNNSPYSEQYYGEERTATITVTEHNFDASCIQVDITASGDSILASVPNIGTFTTVGDVHTAKVTFSEDADYTISAACTDLAGNAGNSIAEQRFTIDLTAPEIVITGVSEDVTYNEKEMPVVTVSDANFDAEGISIEIIGGKNGLIEDITPSVTRTDEGQSYIYPDLQYLAASDDCYVLKVTASDKAGHQSQALVNYRVNRFGSIYTPNQALKEMIEQYYGHASDDCAVIVSNVDELLDYQVSYTLNHEIVNLTEGVDYEVSSLKTQDNWMQYEYRFHASVFEREGIYVLTVSSTDAAGNITDNKSKEQVLEFCIDNTAPSCIISGVAEGQSFEEEDEISIGLEVYDNIKLSTVSVLLNGTERYTQDDLVDGRIDDILIDRNMKEQVLTVVCCDAAGNRQVETVHFQCHINALDIPAWVLILIIVILFLPITYKYCNRKKS